MEEHCRKMIALPSPADTSSPPHPSQCLPILLSLSSSSAFSLCVHVCEGPLHVLLYWVHKTHQWAERNKKFCIWDICNNQSSIQLKMHPFGAEVESALLCGSWSSRVHSCINMLFSLDGYVFILSSGLTHFVF